MTASTRQSITEYFQSNCHTMWPVTPGNQLIDASFELPEGWVPVQTDIAPGAYALAADPNSAISGFAPNAALFITRTQFFGETEEAIDAAFEDAYRLPGWATLTEDIWPRGGFASAAICGTYKQDWLTLYTDHRYLLIPQDPWTYLVQATFTTLASAPRESRCILDTLRIDLAGE